jgi:hypothetical protein
LLDEKRRAAWHGPGHELRFEPEDFDIVDLVLGQVPELRICAWALKRARRIGIQYPIKDARALGRLLEGDKFAAAGLEFSRDHISRLMPSEFFPIADEADLVSRTYIVLIRAKHDRMQETRSAGQRERLERDNDNSVTDREG